MSLLEWVIAALLLVFALALAATLFAILTRSRAGPSAVALGRGELHRALASGRSAGERSERLSAAVAARLLLDLPTAASLLDSLLAADPRDGEAWLERGVTAAWAGDAASAEAAFARVLTLRSDLAEPLTLHRAWLALALGDRPRALQLFEDIEQPLANKLNTDLGPGDPAFAEWFLVAAVLWHAAGRAALAREALAHGIAASPNPRLAGHLAAPAPELLAAGGGALPG